MIFILTISETIHVSKNPGQELQGPHLKNVFQRLWYELILALWCHSIVWSLFSWNIMWRNDKFHGTHDWCCRGVQRVLPWMTSKRWGGKGMRRSDGGRGWSLQKQWCAIEKLQWGMRCVCAELCCDRTCLFDLVGRGISSRWAILGHFTPHLKSAFIPPGVLMRDR